MNKKCKQKSTLLALMVGLTLSSLNFTAATADEDPTFDLDQVVVTATKTEKKVKEVPVAVEIITREEMDKKNIKRVDDALKNITGVYVQQGKGIMGGASTDKIVMRGFGSQKQVLVMIDGQPINEGYNGGVSLANIPTDNIDRIEVIKGPASALYGSNAMGGVINIITQDKAKQETIIRSGIGGQGTNSQSVYTSGSAGNFDYFITAQRTSADGYVTNPGNPAQGDNGMKRELLDGKLVYHVDDHSKISLSGGSNNFKYFYKGITDRGESNEDSWTLSYENKLNSTSSLKLSYGEKKVDYWYVSSGSYTANPSKTTQGEVQYDFKLRDKDSLTVGYSYRTEQANSFAKAANIGGKTETDSFYLQDEHKVNDSTMLYLGGRYDNWRFYDGYTTVNSKGTTNQIPESKENSFNPKVGVVHKVNDKLTLRSSIGTAFRAPNEYELAKDWVNGSTIYKCNPGLQPEKSTNYELGFDYQADKTLLAKMSIFHSNVTDAIGLKSTKSGATTVKQYINSDKVRINGLEFGLTKQLSDAWSSFVNYTYTDAKIVKSAIAPEDIGEQLADVPKHMFNIGVNYSAGRWQGSLTGNYQSNSNEPGKQGQKGYGTNESHFIVDTKVSYKMTKDTSISLSVDNLFDKKYYVYYLAAPRTAYLELTHKF
ncbi:TonB-dependent receptor plug domain-containing protein [Sporomusa acidovorans]|uniref:Colicin I receptor n=1 Tax=Sporomusa acidovorans (strain ATCC 49682 / DSM 3132 / Mol) TaxID=1123286 RepID=A0ABZ3IYH7_SPOA4|nr:TonB-dependent receptor [Sporomusa acidovorans]OZC22202.1 colicin I receptor precursor [Sporomusa acidovorans DSM 3132]SDE81673.1 vitamin B12 transporter [Sporomusa acidovorans]